jgi:hypothetical protein
LHVKVAGLVWVFGSITRNMRENANRAFKPINVAKGTVFRKVSLWRYSTPTVLRSPPPMRLRGRRQGKFFGVEDPLLSRNKASPFM